jgi:general nucleoside transport system ATP-binding protein
VTEPLTPPALELIDIVKRFGAIEANRKVTMRIPHGAVTAIVGENGAGKTTAMNVAYALYRPDGGEVRLNGRPVHFSGPAEAIAAGVGMVHQHFKLVETFTVLENVVLGAEGGPWLGTGLKRAQKALARLADEYGLSVSFEARIADLPLGVRQKVEILKALYRGARILILDEPTAVLTPQETVALFAVVAALKAKGAGVVLISHKLNEVMAAADRIVVMRAGAVVAEREKAATDEAELAELMVGHKLRLDPERPRQPAGDVVLSADRLVVAGRTGRPVLDDVSLALRAGEIVGVAGVAGGGQSELLETLAGLRALSSGCVVCADVRFDRRHPATPALMRGLGVSYIPEDRQRFAMAGPLSAAATAMLGRQRMHPYADCFGRLDAATAAAACTRLMAQFDIRPPDPTLTALRLSGGNQQKLVVGRETDGRPRVVLAGQPTRGVDIAAVVAIRRRLARLRDGGTGVLLVSSDLDEILALSDRIVVMSGGRIAGEVAADKASERTLGLMMGAAWTGQAA